MTDHVCATCGDTGTLQCMCVLVTRRRLDEIQHHTAILATAGLRPGGRGLDGMPRPRGYGSRPPVSLDVLTALDYRSHVDGDGQDDDPEETTLSVLRSVQQIATYVADKLYRAAIWGSVLPRPLTVANLTNYLHTHTEWAISQEWGPHYVDIVKQVHGQTCRQAHDRPPEPLGECIEDGCDGTVWRDQKDTDRGRCSTDRKHTYTGLHLVRLADRRKT